MSHMQTNVQSSPPMKPAKRLNVHREAEVTDMARSGPYHNPEIYNPRTHARSYIHTGEHSFPRQGCSTIPQPCGGGGHRSAPARPVARLAHEPEVQALPPAGPQRLQCCPAPPPRSATAVLPADLLSEGAALGHGCSGSTSKKRFSQRRQRQSKESGMSAVMLVRGTPLKVLALTRPLQCRSLSNLREETESLLANI